MNSRASLEIRKQSFIDRAIEIHKNKYDYSLVNYINTNSRVIIKCPIHGEFTQTPSKHLQLRGCPTCGGTIKLTNTEFIQKSKNIHGDIYDYSLVNYINARTKVKIKCKICNTIFNQQPYHHSTTTGCPICVGKYKTTDRFITEANELHDSKYDYSRVKYKSATHKIEILCKRCGNTFKQIPNSHLRGCGCNICGGSKKSNTKTFIQKANRLHRNKYDYSLVEYTNSHAKINIKCNKCHAVFSNQPSNHLQGQGCPHCKFSKGESIISNFLNDNKFFYIFQKRFSDCRGTGNKPLAFDFYLPLRNILIEFDGKQHFMCGNIGKHRITEKELTNTKAHDILKNNYCRRNKIKLIRISYKNIKNIDKILTKKLLK
jgi:predicted  nucleic acid-binding Zn-ribbon protein